MQDFSSQLHKVISDPKNGPEQEELHQVAYRLARAIRASIETTWDTNLGILKDSSRK
jgi:hypothetical protein